MMTLFSVPTELCSGGETKAHSEMCTALQFLQWLNKKSFITTLYHYQLLYDSSWTFKDFGTHVCLSPCMINSMCGNCGRTFAPLFFRFAIEYFIIYSLLFSSGINIFFFCHVSSQVMKALWWYYFSKLIEFMDTFFFILRKNNHQITFLHIYHHASMLNIWWFVLNWVPCGHCECFNTTSPSSDSNLSSNHIYCLAPKRAK